MTVKTDLVELGWPGDDPQSIEDFQRGWNLGPALTIDGKAGPKTRDALALSVLRKKAGLPDFSPHFSAVEFQCNCGDDGRTVADGCRRIWIPRSTVQMAERFRTLVGPFRPERACRCERENKRVGGTPGSMHLVGKGLDVPIYTCTVAQVRAATGCDGVGTYEKNGRLYVRHIDNRGSWAQWPYPYKPFTPLAPAPLKAMPPAPAPTPAPTPAPSEEDDMFTDADRTDLRAAKADAYAAHKHAKDSALRVVALEATVGVLANSQGLNPELVQKTIAEAVAAALSKITLTTAPTEETP